MSAFKVGDRVSFLKNGAYPEFVSAFRQRGTVREVIGRICLVVEDHQNSLWYYHCDNLRKLVKKPKREPRRIWINIYPDYVVTEFQEVLPKREKK